MEQNLSTRHKKPPMPNIAAILKDEISRLSRREIRKTVQPIRKASAGYRREIATLKRQVLELRRKTDALAKRATPANATQEAIRPIRPTRFVAKGLRSLRVRLGLSAPELARLMGVSDQSIYNWELKKTSPRKEQLAQVATIRSLGKREAQRRLEAVEAERGRKRK
jgi:DNA-binding transcriptional regulator YiaG